jgi:hypothetical protein
MSELDSFKSGSVILDGAVIIKRGVSAVEIMSGGVVFDREFDFKNGWVMRASDSHFILGRKVNVNFSFLNDCLELFRFSLEGGDSETAEVLKKKHDSFLLAQLGEPQRRNEIMTIYDFSWGGITSQIDPRGGACNVEINWDREKS